MLERYLPKSKKKYNPLVREISTKQPNKIKSWTYARHKRKECYQKCAQDINKNNRMFGKLNEGTNEGIEWNVILNVRKIERNNRIKCNLRCVQDINNGNWTEWGAIWAEIIHVISIWNHNYHFRPKLHDTSFNYHFITSILKSPKYRTWSVHIFYWCCTE